jgi:hypothetical protein
MKNLTYILVAGLVVMLSACGDNNNNLDAGALNTKASLPASLNFTSLGYKVITSSINKKLGTMSTLYGNKQALANAIAGNDDVKAGEEFALITWKQQDDDRWFGAKIPGDLQSVETIKAIANGSRVTVSYKCFDGKALIANTDTIKNAERIKYIFAQQPSVMP